MIKFFLSLFFNREKEKKVGSHSLLFEEIIDG